MQPFLALITPVGGDGMAPQPPLGIWGGAPLPWPGHPIAPGGPPPGIWPSPGYPAHPIAPGGPPPGIWPSPGYPAHPIAPGGPPPGIWPSPGVPTHPIAPGGPPPGIWPSPGVPTHPIAPGGQPPGIWGGGNEPFPTPPIFIPPGLPPVEQPEGPIDWHTAWSPNTGWIVVGVPNVPVPTPSK
jgi:hypothetical protein